MHARKKHVATVLHRAGVMDIHGNRIGNVRVTSLGDVVSLGYDEPEADFLRWVDKFIDEWLVGNHEAFHLCPHPELWFAGSDGVSYLDFNGKEVFPGTADPEAVKIIQEWSRQGRYKAASQCGPWLLSHAGLRPALQKFYREHGAELPDIVDDLNHRWKSCVATPGLNDQFITNGMASAGGILWHRFQYLRAGYAKTHMPQIVGHSSDCGPNLWRTGNLWCIDSEGGCVGLYTEDDGLTFRLITSLPNDKQQPRFLTKNQWPPDTDRLYTLTQ